jgi:hypothetical protein
LTWSEYAEGVTGVNVHQRLLQGEALDQRLASRLGEDLAALRMASASSCRSRVCSPVEMRA